MEAKVKRLKQGKSLKRRADYKPETPNKARRESIVEWLHVDVMRPAGASPYSEADYSVTFRSVDGFHLSQRSCAASTGRTHDRKRPCTFRHAGRGPSTHEEL
jgi:hypothetical protein